MLLSIVHGNLKVEREDSSKIMRTFKLVRDEDVSGISGTGVVARGVEFGNGTTVMQWDNTGSICIYASVDVLESVHGHEGRTRVEFDG